MNDTSMIVGCGIDQDAGRRRANWAAETVAKAVQAASAKVLVFVG
jgi:hypothetical protein